jgi:PAS domain S-box-containing protein
MSPSTTPPDDELKQAETLLRAEGTSLVDAEKLEAEVKERALRLERSNAQLGLARELAFLIAEAKTVDDALELALRKICESTGWVLGQAWTVDAAGSCLECSPAWHAGSNGLEPFRYGSEAMTFEPGVGLPGRAWSSKKPAWIKDVKCDGNFPRSGFAKEVGLGAGMAVPVLDGEVVVAVIEFFRLEAREPDRGLVDVVATVAAQMGSLIQRTGAEETLRASEERFRAVAETAQDAIVSADSRGEIIYFNPTAEQLFGYSARELRGKPLTILMPEKFHDDHRRGLQRFLSTGDARLIGKTVEVAGRRKHGGEFPVELSLSTWTADNALFFTAILRDITERQRTEEKLQKALATERDAGERLRELDRLKDEFLSTVSHELRTPLTAISGFAEVLRESPDHEDRAEWLERIYQNASEMGGMIEQLLDYSRLEAGKVALDVRPLRIREMVLHCVELAKDAMGERQISLEIPDGLAVQADERGFERILMNLLTNAAKYSPEGSAVRVTARAENGEATIAVQDEGIGISPAEHAQVFERFYRSPAVSVKRGTGIGLGIVHRYVEMLGGEVWVNSEPGRGSTFLFRLPLSAE